MDRYLRLRLVALVVLAVVPALVLMGFTAKEQREFQHEETEQIARRLVLLSSSQIEQLVASGRQLLETLARVPEVRDSTASCPALLADVLAGSPAYGNMGVASLDGTITCSAVPSARPVNIADRTYFRRAITTRGFAVGEYLIGRITGKPSVTFGAPVFDERGNVSGVVFAAADLTFANELLDGVPLPDGATFTIVDTAGTVLVRQPDPARWVGRRFASAPLVRAMQAAETGSGRFPGLDGVERLYAFSPLGDTRSAAAAVGIPISTAFGPIDALFRRNLLLLSGVLLVAVVAALWLGTVFVVEPVRRAFRLEHEATERLREADAMKNAFVAALAHDVRNPLTAILGFTRLLQQGTRSFAEDEARTMLSRIELSARRIERLAGAMLDVERLSRGSAQPQRDHVDVAALAQKAVEQVDDDGHVELPGAPVHAFVDPAQVERIIENLVANALKHAGGGRVAVCIARTDGAVLLSVEDEGPGVPDEIKEAIFEPFRRGDTRRSGTGIGLHLVARFAEMHGGRAWVEDRPSGGSAFKVLLPDGDDQADAATANAGLVER